MDKISHIVPANARMSAADVQKSGAVRPGAPGFGRQTGQSRGGGLSELSTAERAGARAADLADQRRPGETAIIDQLARDFFLTEPAGPAAVGPVDVTPAGTPPKGFFVDVHA